MLLLPSIRGLSAKQLVEKCLACGQGSTRALLTDDAVIQLMPHSQPLPTSPEGKLQLLCRANLDACSCLVCMWRWEGPIAVSLWLWAGGRIWLLQFCASSHITKLIHFIHHTVTSGSRTIRQAHLSPQHSQPIAPTPRRLLVLILLAVTGTIRS